ncbi:MAG: hypothetical protein AB7H96_01540 [Vicinamibacterales bacterium]
MRIVGPSFDVVSRWAEQGIPLKVAMAGIDRYFERYYRKGPRRRPVRIDFCEADVLDLFDEWRRATGLSAGAAAPAPAGGDEPPPARRKGPTLPEHLERVLVRLSSLRATGVLPDAADPIVDRVSAELDAARSKPGGLRGDERQAVIERLSALDAELIVLAAASAAAEVRDAAARHAVDELAAFRATMSADAFEQALTLARTRALRERLGLPSLSFS